VGLCVIESFIQTWPEKVKVKNQQKINRIMKMIDEHSTLHNTDNIDDINLDTQIYCNVELNTDYIEAVGFDMDFTLAQVSIISYTTTINSS